jgi:uncharacterized protein (DUF39 family)
VRTAPLSSLYKARMIAEELKIRLLDGSFVMTVPAAKLPRRDQFKGLEADGRL